MGIKYYKPTSAGRRGGSVSDFADCTDPRVNAPEKSLLETLKKTGGRNNQGVVTSRFRGGGHKQRYRIIDFKRNTKDGVEALVISIQYDPCRSARIALIQFQDETKEKRYYLAPDGLKAGDKVMHGDTEAVEPKLGNCMPLSRIPLGMTIHNIELTPGKGGQICRSAGTHATLTNREKEWAQVTLPSGEVRRVNAKCRATIGSVSNPDHMNISLGKAGRKRWLGRKPHNRGTSQNPVDHPMGGGEGKTSGGRHPTSPWGWKTKGMKTRNNKRTDGFIVRRRKAKG
jgi:large subunit ribosomal protein L2